MEKISYTEEKMKKLNKKVFNEGMDILLLTLGECLIFMVITFFVFFRSVSWFI